MDKTEGFVHNIIMQSFLVQGAEPGHLAGLNICTTFVHGQASTLGLAKMLTLLNIQCLDIQN
jgi:hypothetical protein